MDDRKPDHAKIVMTYHDAAWKARNDEKRNDAIAGVILVVAIIWFIGMGVVVRFF